MKKNASQAKEKTGNRKPLRFEDTRLKRSYSVREIAMLAAGCRGETPQDRVEDAVHLLSAVERSASLSKKEKQRERIRHGMSIRGEEATPERIDSREKALNWADRESALWDEILNAAERDEATGKIKRSSLALEICKASDLDITTEAHAARKYSEWLKSELADSATRYEVVSLTEYKSAFESNTKVRLIHDDETAMTIIISFLLWLEIDARAKPEIPAPVQSHKEGTEGQIVSPKDRGAGRGDDGKYSRSKKNFR